MSSRATISASIPSGTPRSKCRAASTAPTNSLSQIGSSQEPAPASAVPRRRASVPSSTSVAAAAPITPSAAAARAGVGPSTIQNSQPSGKRARLSRFGRVKKGMGAASGIRSLEA